MTETTLETIYKVLLELKDKTEKLEGANSKVISSLDKYNEKYVYDHFLANIINDLINLYDNLEHVSSKDINSKIENNISDNLTLSILEKNETKIPTNDYKDEILAIKESVELILLKNSIKMINPSEQENFDMKIHKVKDVINTSEANLKGKIAKIHEIGFAICDFENKDKLNIIRPAKVTIYK